MASRRRTVVFSSTFRIRPIQACMLSAFLLAGATVGLAESRPAWLGIYVGSEERANVDAGESAAPVGVPVAGVVNGSPAAKAGLRARDRITSVNGHSIESFADLRSLMGDASASEWVRLSVDRGGEQVELETRLDTRPADTRRLVARKGWIGVQAIDLPESLRAHFGAPSDAGVMIADIDADSPAFIAGLEIGDVVYEIDGDPVVSARDLAARFERGGIGNKIGIVLVRSGVEIEIEATIVEKPEEQPGSDATS